MATELDVLMEQLDELLVEGVEDADDALELATVAGLAARLGGEGAGLEEAEAWRDGDGRDVLDEILDEIDWDALLEAIDGVLGGATEEEVEEAVLELDDVICAAVWAGRAGDARKAASRFAATVRQVPEPFAFLADEGSQMARLKAVGEHPDVYDYWMAIADAGAFRDEEETSEK